MSRMDLQTALLYSIIRAVAETVLPVPDAGDAVGQASPSLRTLPAEARPGRLQPPIGNGLVVIDGEAWRLSPGAQIRNQQNLIVVPMQIVEPVEVVYLTDASGAVNRVWMLTATEARMSQSR